MYFLPERPLLWTNLMPAEAVASVSFRVFGAGGGGAAPRVKRTQRTAGTKERRCKTSTSRHRGLRDGPWGVQRHALVLVDLLALVVVLRAQHAGPGGDRLRRLLGLEAAEQRRLPRRALPVAQGAPAEHRRVVHLHVLGVHHADAVEDLQRLPVLPLEE